MFDLSRAAYYADFITAPLFVIAILAMQLGAFFCLGVLSGALGWTLFEYFVHRFILHSWLRGEHVRHHADPVAYMGASPFLTGGLMTGLWIASRLTFGSAGDAPLLGFVLGYVTYIAIHDRYHHGRIQPGDWLYPGFHRHALHHRGLEKNFGVTTPIWDLAFGTYRR